MNASVKDILKAIETCKKNAAKYSGRKYEWLAAAQVYENLLRKL